MTFNSLQFAVLLGIVISLYWSLRLKGQNRLLLLASYIFYGWWDWRFLVLLWLTTIVDFIAGQTHRGRPTDKERRGWLIGQVTFNIGILAFFKYFNFFTDSANDASSALGLGVTVARVSHPPADRHQLLRLPRDQLRGRHLPAAPDAERNLLTYALFIVVLPSADRRSDRARVAPAPAAPGGAARPNANQVYSRARADRARPVHEGRDRRRRRAVANSTFRGSETRGIIPLASGAVRVRDPDLRRLRRVHRHRAWVSRAVRDRGVPELRAAVPVDEHHAVLADVAHLTVELAARLPLRAARRQPARPTPDLPQPLHHDAPRRALARRVMDLRRVGGAARHCARDSPRARRVRATRSTTPTAPARRPPHPRDVQLRHRAVGDLPLEHALRRDLLLPEHVHQRAPRPAPRQLESRLRDRRHDRSADPGARPDRPSARAAAAAREVGPRAAGCRSPAPRCSRSWFGAASRRLPSSTSSSRTGSR